MTSRETIISALFTLLQGTAGINTSSRKVKHWSEVTQREQPALFLAQGKETLQAAKMGEPVRHTLTAMVYLYAHTQADSKTAPSQILNPVVDAIEAALHPTFEGTKQTLGGLVVHAGIVGTIETDEGALGDQGVVIIPIEIVFIQ